AYGVLLGAMGVGALFAAWYRERFLDRFPDRPSRVTITGFGIAGLVVGLAPGLWVATLGMLASGFFWVLTLTSLNATAQLISPSWIRGRAMSLYSLSFGGIIPLGSILAGVVADATNTATTIVIFSSAAVLLGVLSPLLGVPSIRNVLPPEFSEDRLLPTHDTTVAGESVVVLNAWQIDRADLAAFTELMTEVRLVRLRTGAYRWQLMRTASDPLRIIEFFEIGSWEEHLAQHGRIDDASAEVIARARAFDTTGGPTTRHLIGVDPRNPELFEELIEKHEQMHRTDGSIPAFDQDS
ncbi:MAG: MFS transporter, partial [Acidimicrobiia bacterium]